MGLDAKRAIFESETALTFRIASNSDKSDRNLRDGKLMIDH